jgi:N-sulfoglucosamine sulfohydrolase
MKPATRMMTLLLVALICITAGKSLATDRPNIMFIIADDCTFRDIGCYGGQAHTPNIDKLAQQGMRFEQCFQAAPMCSPTRHNIYTGLYPVKSGAYPNHTHVNPGVKSVVHYLEPLGYRVALNGKRHIGPAEAFPFEYGGKKNPDMAFADTFIGECVKGNNPFCIFQCSNEPHSPWNKGDASRYNPRQLTLPPYFVDTAETRKTLCDYLAEITYYDGQVGESLALLDKHGVADNTLVIVVSEQGSSFPFGKWTCYDTGLQSACIARWPGKVPAGIVNNAMIEYVDFVPTFVEAAGSTPALLLDGKSLLPVLIQGKTQHKDYVYGEMTTRGIINGSDTYGIRSIRSQEFKYIWNFTPDTPFTNACTKSAVFKSWQVKAETDPWAAGQVDRYQHRPEVELYNIQTDPLEMQNVADDPAYSAVKADLQKRLRAWMRDCGDKGQQTEIDAREHQGKAKKALDKNKSRKQRQADNAPAKRPNIFFFFADDWGRYASIYEHFAPNAAFRTPNMDRFAQEGIRFNNAHVTAPSCTPCRSSLLSGQYFYRTGQGAILQGAQWDLKIPSYPLLLEKAGYHIGYTYKVWSPGAPVDAPYGGKARAYASAGRKFCGFSQNATKMVQQGKTPEQAKTVLCDEALQNFDAFLKDRKPDQPFCYWFGPTNTHRKWIKGSGKDLWGLNPDALKGRMPAFLPDVHEVRQDMCDYLGEVLALDRALGLFLIKLEAIGERDNTLIVVSGDHGIPGFPRGKTNLYNLGTEVSLFAQWPGQAPGAREVDDFINLMDLAPTFLEAAGEPVPECMTGRSIVPLLRSKQNGWLDMTRDHVVTGRERHVAKARAGNLPFPERSIRTRDFLYIRNFKPDRWPMGTPTGLDNPVKEPSYTILENNTFAAFGDLDASPTKAWMVKHRQDPQWQLHWRLGFEKRPAEELYDLRTDPDYLHNVAGDLAYVTVRAELSKRLMKTLKDTGDPRVQGDGLTFERSPFVP